jgi:putative heme-binding domain-containing protein
VFRKECATCHRLEGVGYALGLPLSAIKERGAEGILLNLLDPNRNINPEYSNYVVVTDAGRTITGMIAAETATSITLRRAEDESDTVLRTEIDELVDTGVSIMPEGLEKQLSKQDLADLIAYLMLVR